MRVRSLEVLNPVLENDPSPHFKIWVNARARNCLHSIISQLMAAFVWPRWIAWSSVYHTSRIDRIHAKCVTQKERRQSSHQQNHRVVEVFQRTSLSTLLEEMCLYARLECPT